MSDLLKDFRGLRRPRLLISAARSGAALYQRNRDLRRLLGSAKVPCPQTALRQLMLLEGEMDADRRDKVSTYRITRHVEILAALLAEVRASRKPALVKESCD